MRPRIAGIALSAGRTVNAVPSRRAIDAISAVFAGSAIGPVEVAARGGSAYLGSSALGSCYGIVGGRNGRIRVRDRILRRANRLGNQRSAFSSFLVASMNML